MGRVVEIAEVFACAPAAGATLEQIMRAQARDGALTAAALRSVMDQYEDLPRSRRPRVDVYRIDWLTTKDPAQVEAFQPAHDCAACRAGHDQTLTSLRNEPDRYVALANIYYREHWKR